MKALTIAHVDDALTWRGGERQVIELIGGLSRRGVNNILVCRPGSEISRCARERGIEVFHQPLRGEWDVASAYAIRRFASRRGIDVIHAHTAHSHTIALYARAGCQGPRLVVSRRVDFHLHGFLSRHVKYGSSVDRIIAVSDAVRRILVEGGVDGRRISVVHDGFIPGEFCGAEESAGFRAESGISPDAPVIVTVAALAPHKAHGVLLRAAHAVVKTHPGAVFLFAGEGEMRGEIERDIHNLGLEDSVRLLGFVKDVEKVFRAADIFAVSSNEEGLCSSILDAMFFRLPIVATSAGGIPELVRDGVNGYVVPVGDHRTFAERLSALIEDPESRNRMGARSSPILDEHSIDRTVEKTLEIYHSLFENEVLERR